MAKMQAMRHGGMKAAPKAPTLPKIAAKPSLGAAMKGMGHPPQSLTPVSTDRGAFKIKG